MFVLRLCSSITAHLLFSPCPFHPSSSNHPIPTHPFLFSSCVTIPSSSSLLASKESRCHCVCCLSVKPRPMFVQASCSIPFHPTLCRHPFHFSPVIVHEPVVSGLPVQSTAGNFLLIVHWTIPCIPGILPGITRGPARCEGVCNTRQMLRPTDTIHTSSSDLLMGKDSVIDEQKEDEEPGRKGRGRHKKTVAMGV